MLFFRKYCSFLATPLAALMMIVSMPMGVAQAAMVSTEQVIESSATEAERARIADLIMRQDVQRYLRAQGVDPDEALARVATLSDAEVDRIATRIDTMPAGQGAVEALISALLIVFIVLLITDIVGVTDVFSFDRGR